MRTRTIESILSTVVLSAYTCANHQPIQLDSAQQFLRIWGMVPIPVSLFRLLILWCFLKLSVRTAASSNLRNGQQVVLGSSGATTAFLFVDAMLLVWYVSGMCWCFVFSLPNLSLTGNQRPAMENLALFVIFALLFLLTSSLLMLSGAMTISPDRGDQGSVTPKVMQGFRLMHLLGCHCSGLCVRNFHAVDMKSQCAQFVWIHFEMGKLYEGYLVSIFST